MKWLIGWGRQDREPLGLVVGRNNEVLVMLIVLTWKEAHSYCHGTKELTFCSEARAVLSQGRRRLYLSLFEEGGD